MESRLMSKTKALITGITGQDGSYLAELLFEKGYVVHGIGDGPVVLIPVGSIICIKIHTKLILDLCCIWRSH